jgi:hypothetical protein
MNLSVISSKAFLDVYGTSDFLKSKTLFFGPIIPPLSIRKSYLISP